MPGTLAPLTHACGGAVVSNTSMTRRTLQAVAVLALCGAALCAQSSPLPSWGPTTRGLRLGIAVVTGGGVAFDVSLENAGTDDVVLNLGYMLANGKVMFPKAVRVALVQPSGATCDLDYLDRRYPGVAGRMDDFIVALSAEAVYTLRLTGDRLWCAAEQRYQATLAPGRYRVKARFEGRGAVAVNLDMTSVALLHFWKGIAESAQATFDVRRRTGAANETSTP